MRTLQRGEYHLWYWSTEHDSVARYVDKGISMLSPDERERFNRYRDAGAAETFAASRILLRSALSQYYSLNPSRWRFSTNQWGRPEIAGPAIPGRIRFSISHKKRLITCLIGIESDLGLDIEDVSQTRPGVLAIASRFFSRAEFERLSSLPQPQQLKEFYRYWTLKEAYVKARGMGLVIPLRHIAFDCFPTVTFDPALQDKPELWEFQSFHLDGRHIAGIAAKRVDGSSLKVRMQDAAEYV